MRRPDVLRWCLPTLDIVRGDQARRARRIRRHRARTGAAVEYRRAAARAGDGRLRLRRGRHAPAPAIRAPRRRGRRERALLDSGRRPGLYADVLPAAPKLNGDATRKGIAGRLAVRATSFRAAATTSCWSLFFGPRRGRRRRSTCCRTASTERPARHQGHRAAGGAAQGRTRRRSPGTAASSSCSTPAAPAPPRRRTSFALDAGSLRAQLAGQRHRADLVVGRRAVGRARRLGERRLHRGLPRRRCGRRPTQGTA